MKRFGRASICVFTIFMAASSVTPADAQHGAGAYGILAVDSGFQLSPLRGRRVAPATHLTAWIPDNSAEEVERKMSAWKVVGITAATGAVLAGAAGYMLYPNMLDPWLTRVEHTAVTAAQGAIVGAGLGGVYIIARRFW